MCIRDRYQRRVHGELKGSTLAIAALLCQKIVSSQNMDLLSESSPHRTSNKPKKGVRNVQKRSGRLPPELKRSLIDLVLQRKKTVKKAAKELKINYSTAKTIVRVHKRRLREEPPMSEGRRCKFQLLEEHASNEKEHDLLKFQARKDFEQTVFEYSLLSSVRGNTISSFNYLVWPNHVAPYQPSYQPSYQPPYQPPKEMKIFDDQVIKSILRSANELNSLLTQSTILFPRIFTYLA
eukprot:TRINITY_DN6570_c0_g1_i1.p1 TRINITY_DN6570_c0_g1~~TRINITY_DN6570_c0_g1_i1.p1  ORF type:complete len:236 (+),score=12.03 TRINITY_DN6570_c0_g1_i1:63-770(+)